MSSRSDTAADPIVTLVFTDLVNSTAVKKHLPGDDISARNRLYFETILKPHRRRIEAELANYGGRVVKTEGDAYFVVFGSAANAARWSVAVQISHLEDPIATPLGAVQVKIGMHTGSPIPDGPDFIGQEVDYAARIASIAKGGEVLLSEVTAVLVRSAQITELAVVNRGDRELKGIGTVPVFELLYGGKTLRGPVSPPSRRSRKQPRTEPKRQPDPPGRDFDTVIPGLDRPEHPPFIRNLGLILLSSVMVTGVVLGVRALGWLQPLELKAYDGLLQLRPHEGVDPRILVVTFTETDVQQLNEPSLSDRNLLKVLKTLEAFEPAVIGLDIYRDVPIGAGQAELVQYLQQNPQIVGVCKVPDSSDRLGVKPTPGIPLDQTTHNRLLGFSNSLFDTDGVLRRHYLSQTPPPGSACLTEYALNVQLAFRYLFIKQGIQPEFPTESTLKLGTATFQRLPDRAGGYQKFDNGGFQILLNSRSPAIANQVTVSDVLNGRLQPQAIKDHIILIGVDREDIDRVLTPYGTNIAGVLQQAQGLSQILSAVLDQRPLLQVWDLWFEGLWVWSWAVVGGSLVILLRGWVLPSLGGAVIFISGTCFIALVVFHSWIPLIPSVLSLLLAGSAIAIHQFKQQES